MESFDRETLKNMSDDICRHLHVIEMSLFWLNIILIGIGALLFICL